MQTTRPNAYKFNRITWLSLLIAITLFAFFFLIFSISTNNTSSPKNPSKPFVSFYNLGESNINSNIILNEQALIFDSEPIFIPTQWSESIPHFNKLLNTSLFQDFEPNITLYDYQTIFSNSKKKIILSPLDILNTQSINPFSGINQEPINIQPLKKRTAHITIINLNTGKIIEEYALHLNSNPEIEDELWSPLQFYFLVDESGPILPALMTKSSGLEQIDNFFKNYISTPPTKLSSLDPGYYNIIINP